MQSIWLLTGFTCSSTPRGAGYHAETNGHMVCSACESPIRKEKKILRRLGIVKSPITVASANIQLLLQSCRRNLSIVGRPVIIPGLPELAGLVGNMAAQWEAHAQKQATQIETDGRTAEEATPADDAAAVAADTTKAEASADGVTNTDQDVHATASDKEAVSTSGAEADEGSAVDANTDMAMPDMTGDPYAAQKLAGVASATDAAANADAVEPRQQKKQKAVVKG